MHIEFQAGEPGLCSVLCLEVHDSRGAVWQRHWLALEGPVHQLYIPRMLSGSRAQRVDIQSSLPPRFQVRIRLVVTVAIQWHFGALCEMNWLPSPQLLVGNIVNEINLCSQRKL